MADKKWHHDLSIQFKDGQVIEINITEGDRLILKLDHVITEESMRKIHKMLSRWLDGTDPILILDPGINLAIVRVENHVKTGH